MKNDLRFRFLFAAFLFTHLTYGQLTKLSNNTNLTGLLLNNKALFESDVNHTLWTSDGTPPGTLQYTTKVTGDTTNKGGGGVLGSKIFFAGIDAAHGSELWVTDGTDAGTALVKDIEPGTNSSTPTNFFAYNNQLFFFDSTAASGLELWKTDGTAAGTVMVKDINPGPGNSGDHSFLSYFVNNGTLYFTANDGTHGRELWKTNGTAGGTVMIKDINPGVKDGIGSLFGGLSEFFAAGTLTLFTADDGTTGGELWKTDGTEAGTVLVKDINSGILPSSPGSFVMLNNKILFSANTTADGVELWTTDGSAAGTKLVKDINPGVMPSSPFLFFSIIFDNKLLFTATDTDHGTELWTTDGTGAGTTLLKDINPGKAGSAAFALPDFRLSNLVFTGGHTPPFNGKAFVIADDGTKGRELWITDGTAKGTVLVKDVYAGDEDGVTGGSFFYTQNILFFEGRGSDEEGDELWQSDGTAEGTKLIKDINPGAKSSNLTFNFVFNNHLYLTADDGDNDEGLNDLYVLDETVTLPITLFRYAATVQQSKAVKLTWTTATEINSSHFDIERSADGIHFSNIDKVNAVGNSSLQQHYQYIDLEPAHLNNPVLYYRLKLVDKDALNSSRYSQVLAVHFKGSSFRFTLSPNPVKDQLSVVVAPGDSKNVALRITDASGKQFYQQKLSSTQNIVQQNINVSHLQKGIYYIQLITDNSNKIQKFIKQ